MGRYTGPKARINRRLEQQIYETSGAIRASEKRQQPPGQHIRKKKLSAFGLALREKQKIKHYYGLRERQLRRYFNEARRLPGNTGERLLLMCECRLDNVIRRAGLTRTRLQARQGVVHSHFQVNGRTVRTPSIVLRPGDVVRVRNRHNLKKIYEELASSNSSEKCDWLSTDEKELEIRVTGMPGASDISLPVDVGQVVVFLSR
jgi:small subunit ribosomal protein S4